MSKSPSAARRALLWWFASPANAHVSVSIAIDFTASKAWLAGLSERGQRVSLHHLIMGAVARVMREFPAANARIFGNTIVRKDEVGIVMPVNLLGHPGERRSELTLAIQKAVDRRSLQELAEQNRRDVESTREGTALDPFTKFMFKFAEHAPGPLFRGGLSVMDKVGQSRLGAYFYELTPFTTAISNPGAAIPQAPGVWLRAAAVSLPQRLVHVGSLWGVSPVQEEVVPVEGRAEVRPILPVVLVFDHRLVDGVMAGRMAQRLAEILQDPAAVFGEEAERRIF
ncbi:MAG TPA: 2-oxo acid dehydrogenase subunit E2 [Myxococcota bacterium]|nr:2-oxo acid dehydrogenase subunit E2 [Myxococcota bacterium]